MRSSSLVLLLILFLCLPGKAAYVEKIKGKKALIVLDGLSVEKGDTLYSLGANSKKVAILKITTVKDNKAIGQVVRGKARVNQEVVTRSGTVAKTDSEAPVQEPSNRKGKKSPFAAGALLGFALDSMDITINGETIEQTGTGFSFFAALDYKIFEWLALRALLGFEDLSVSGDANDPTTECQTCDTDIRYMGGLIWAKLYPIKTPINFWLGGGFGIFHPTNKETNALEEASIDTTGVYAVGGGADINLTPNLYLPAQIEYLFLPSSSDVKTNIYAIRLGLMYRF